MRQLPPVLRNKQILLLRQIATSGSLTQAAQAMGMSYKAAWDALNDLNNVFPEPLTIGNTGGRKGGGSTLTAYGERVLQLFTAVEHEYRLFLSEVGVEASLPDTFGSFLKGVYMKTSARNQFFGKVAAIQTGAVNSAVTVDINGAQIQAIVTNESVVHLNLSIGQVVYALIKASSVMVCMDDEALRLSADNQLAGVVESFQKGAVNAEVTVRLPNHKTVVAIVTNDSVERLNLVVNTPIRAIFSGINVILATEV